MQIQIGLINPTYFPLSHSCIIIQLINPIHTTNKKDRALTLSLMVLQARLELALSYSPNRILSPTRLPIPPLELVIFSCHALAESVDLSTLPLLKTIINRFSSAECHWSLWPLIVTLEFLPLFYFIQIITKCQVFYFCFYITLFLFIFLNF